MKPFILALLCAVLFSCRSTSFRELNLYSHANQAEIETVLGHYPEGSLRFRAALFLVENMIYHESVNDPRLPLFRSRLDSINTTEALNSLCAEIFSYPTQSSADAEVIKADFMIRHIDHAFDVWEHSPWKNKIKFGDFCEYILPYRMADEPLTEWRKILYKKYAPAIAGVSDPQTAYDIIYRKVVREFTLNDRMRIPFTADPLTTDKIMQGTCSDRCIYLLAVLRSLCIPAVMDKTPYWANYSNNGHTWVAYIDSRGKPHPTSEQDSVSSRKNYIDAAFLGSKYPAKAVPAGVSVDSLKKIAKIYRHSFSGDRSRLPLSDLDLPGFLTHPAQRDVTADYPTLNGKLTVRAPKAQRWIFLCTFNSLQQWHPVAIQENRNGKVTFTGLGNNIAYLPVYMEDGDIVSLSNPVIVSGQKRRILNPDYKDSRTVTVHRKYLLLTRWTNRWAPALNGRFEGSNISQYTSDTVMLHRIGEIPVGPTVYQVDSERPYRFYRFRHDRGLRTDIAELEFFNEHGEKITGTAVGRSVDRKNRNRAFDGDRDTYAHGSDSYWIGLDLGEGKEERVTQIKLTLASDRNEIDPGDRYELMVYDRGWRSLQLTTAESDSLTFHDVPGNALLWLRNHTKGIEERIFTYENDRQVWW